MSCQQAPRLTEDPYVFTETVQAAPALFNTQKLVRTQQQPRIVVTADNSAAPQVIFRLNGQSSTLSPVSCQSTSFQQQQHFNGKLQHRNVISISPVGCISSIGSSSHSINSPVVTQTLHQINSPGARTLSATTTVVAGVRDNYFSNSPANNSSNKCPPVRPLEFPLSSFWQSTPLIVQHQSPGSPLSPASSPSVSPTPTSTPPSSSPLLPPSNFHHTTLAQHLQKVGTSSVHALQSLPTQQQHFTITVAGSNNATQKKPIKRSASALLSSFHQEENYSDSKSKFFRGDGAVLQQQQQQQLKQAQPQMRPQQQQQQLQSNHSDLNEIPVNVIYRKPQSTGEISCSLFSNGGVSGNSDEGELGVVTNATSSQGQNVKLISPLNVSNASGVTKTEICTPRAGNENNAPTVKTVTKRAPTATSKAATKRKLLQQELATASGSGAEQCVFVTPAKRDSRVLSSSAKKALKANQSPLSKTKRSYSQTAHHEALERISTTTKAPLLSAVGSPFPSLDDVTCMSRVLPELLLPPPLPPLPPTSSAALSATKPSSPLPPSNKKIKRKNAFKKSRIVPPQPPQPTLAPSCCVQQHWLGVYDFKVNPERISALAPNIGREERIARNKAILRRQAYQLIAAQQFHRSPTAAQKRLALVSRLLQKFNNRESENYPMKKCILSTCSNNALALTTHCYQHITRNAEQHLFLPCTAKFADNSQCRIPVFDITHELPLCQEHAWKRDNYNRILQEQRPKKMSAVMMPLQHHQQPQQQHMLQQNHLPAAKKLSATNQRKRKLNTSNRNPQKRGRKPALNATAPAAAAVVTQTKTTTLTKHRKSSTTSLESIASNSQSQSQFITLTSPPVVLAPPALAPLSGGGYTGPIVGFNRMMNSTEFRSNEINQIVAQFTMATVGGGHDDISGGGFFSPVTQSICHTDNVLTHDMMSICENSSAYASSEDTGVGGLSETELMVGQHDVEEIPLGDTRLLEEHDLTNVLNTLPVDAFNELFTAVRQDEREEVERALELADKQIKSLQQMTIGSDSDFLGDFLDVNDQILDDRDICTEMVPHSPDTSGIDTSTLFVDGGSNSTAGSCTGHTPTDIRGLVQT